jgi:hypothetical protein
VRYRQGIVRARCCAGKVLCAPARVVSGIAFLRCGVVKCGAVLSWLCTARQVSAWVRCCGVLWRCGSATRSWAPAVQGMAVSALVSYGEVLRRWGRAGSRAALRGHCRVASSRAWVMYHRVWHRDGTVLNGLALERTGNMQCSLVHPGVGTVVPCDVWYWQRDPLCCVPRRWQGDAGHVQGYGTILYRSVMDCVGKVQCSKAGDARVWRCDTW